MTGSNVVRITDWKRRNRRQGAFLSVSVSYHRGLIFVATEQPSRVTVMPIWDRSQVVHITPKGADVS